MACSWQSSPIDLLLDWGVIKSVTQWQEEFLNSFDLFWLMTTVWLPCILWRKQILAGKVESLDPPLKANVFDFRGFKWMKVHSNGLFFRLFYVAPCDLLGVAPCDEPFLSPCQPWHWNSTRSRSGISVGVLGGFHLSTKAIRPSVHCVFNMNHKQHYSKRQFPTCNNIVGRNPSIVDFVFWILNGDGSWRWPLSFPLISTRILPLALCL